MSSSDRTYQEDTNIQISPAKAIFTVVNGNYEDEAMKAQEAKLVKRKLKNKNQINIVL